VSAAASTAESSVAADVHGVDSIHDVKVVNLKLHYFVKWTGYDVSNNTWEPEDHIMDPALINAFKLKFASAYRGAVAEIAKRKQEKTSKTTIEQELPAASADVYSRRGRPIVDPRARRD
jgi:outer membrane protein assembly factor BamA